MLIMILINVQYLHSVVFSFKKGWNGEIHSFSDSYHPIYLKKTKFSIPPTGGNSPSLSNTWKILPAVSKVNVMKRKMKKDMQRANVICDQVISIKYVEIG